tara:strand:- start:295 stop:1473 length:1179 start_codon:yes stop_codon:yes gene_type:complete
MKKIFLFLLIFLIFKTNSFSQIIEKNKCLPVEYGKSGFEKGWDMYSKYMVNVDEMKETGRVMNKQKAIDFANKFTQWQKINMKEDHAFTIDTSNGIITETIIYFEEYRKFENEYNASLGYFIDFPKVWTRKFNINSFASGYIEASSVDKGGTENTVQVEMDTNKIYFSIGEPGGRKNLIGTYECMSKKSEGGDIASSGSGFFVNTEGYFITNNHVIENCKQSKITFNEKSINADLIATDKSLDLAILKANVKSKNYLNLSENSPQKLEKIYVAGYPFGKGLSDDLKFTRGIVSSIKGFADNSNQIQIDAAINSGNSGGPIVNEDGSLIAVAVAGLDKSKAEGIGFGIKASSVRNFLEVNNIKYSSAGMFNFGMNSKKLNNLLEKSTVYTFCN